MNQAQCLQQLQDREYALQLLREVGEAIVSGRSLVSVLQLVADRARDLIMAENLLIPMLDQTREKYTYAAASGKDASDIVGSEFPVRVGMCGWVLRNEKPLLYGNMCDANEWMLNNKTEWEEGDISALLVPLMVQHRIIGGLSGTGKVGGGSFTQRDLELLQLFANQVSIAIENARLFQEVNELVASLEQRVIERTYELETTNQELEAFSYSVSHDLRAPLRSIDGFSLALLEDFGSQLDASGKEYLERLRANALHMGELIDAMLLLSRVTQAELHKTPLDLSAMASKIAAQLVRSAPERQITFTITPGMMADGDDSLITALLENLLSNAFKYTGKTTHAVIQLTLTQWQGTSCFCISDNGAGFNMAYADKLFKPFQRLHTTREFDGTGVGLATVKRIVHRHGGWIHAESELGKGASFYFTLCHDVTPKE